MKAKPPTFEMLRLLHKQHWARCDGCGAEDEFPGVQSMSELEDAMRTRGWLVGPNQEPGDRCSACVEAGK